MKDKYECLKVSQVGRKREARAVKRKFALCEREVRGKAGWGLIVVELSPSNEYLMIGTVIGHMRIAANEDEGAAYTGFKACSFTET